MIQLSSPAPETLPVKTGKSPEKAVPPTSGDGRFEQALQQSRQSSRNDRSPESELREQKKLSAQTHKGSGKSKKTSSSEQKAADRESAALAAKDGQEQSSREGKSVSAEKALQAGKTLLTFGNTKHTKSSDKKGSEKLIPSETLAALRKSKNSDSDSALQAAHIASAGNAETSSKEDGDASSVSTQNPGSAAEIDISGMSGTAETAETGLLQNGIALAADGPDLDFRESAKSSKFTKKSLSSSLKKDEELKITVDDRRTPALKEEGVVLKEVEHNAETGSLTLELSGSEEELPGMMVRSDEGGGSAAKFSFQTSEESKGAALLDRQLKNEGTSELTKNIRFVLKDNKEGEIKLILKPEALGRVRINLNLNENNIVGKIIVENNNVRQVFMNNLDSLTRALEDSGFNSAALDVSVGGGQSDGRGGFRDEKPVYFTDNALDDLEDLIPVVYDEGHSLSQVNLMV